MKLTLVERSSEGNPVVTQGFLEPCDAPLPDGGDHRPGRSRGGDQGDRRSQGFGPRRRRWRQRLEGSRAVCVRLFWRNGADVDLGHDRLGRPDLPIGGEFELGVGRGLQDQLGLVEGIH